MICLHKGIFHRHLLYIQSLYYNSAQN